MADQDTGKIYITISDRRIGQGGGEDDPQTQQKETKTKTLGEYAKVQFFHFIKSEANTMVNYTLGNIGNFTGDYQAQRDVQAMLNGIGVATTLGNSFIAGLTLTGGNIAGGLVAVAITGAGQLINYGLNELTNTRQTRNQNYNITQLRELSGLDSLTNGGR